MKTFHYSHSLLLMLLLAAGSITEAWAYDKDEDPPLEYAYDHTLEIQLGTGANLNDYSQLPDEGVALFGHKSWGFEFDFRYTRFFARRWGAFAQIQLFSLGTTDGQMLSSLSPHYNHDGHKVVAAVDDLWDLTGRNGSVYFVNMVGAAYRYDIGRWSFRPRLGLGVNWQAARYAEYYIIDTNTQDMYERVELHTEDQAGHSSHYIPGFAYSPSFQVTFSANNHFFFSAEMQWIGTIGHVYQHTEAKQWRADEPQDWHPIEDFVLQPHFLPSHFVQKTDDHRDRLRMGNFIQFRIGVGFNIGHNRNEKSFRSTR